MNLSAKLATCLTIFGSLLLQPISASASAGGGGMCPYIFQIGEADFFTSFAKIGNTELPVNLYGIQNNSAKYAIDSKQFQNAKPGDLLAVTVRSKQSEGANQHGAVVVAKTLHPDRRGSGFSVVMHLRVGSHAAPLILDYHVKNSQNKIENLTLIEPAQDGSYTLFSTGDAEFTNKQDQHKYLLEKAFRVKNNWERELYKILTPLESNWVTYRLALTEEMLDGKKSKHVNDDYSEIHEYFKLDIKDIAAKRRGDLIQVQQKTPNGWVLINGVISSHFETNLKNGGDEPIMILMKVRLDAQNYFEIRYNVKTDAKDQPLKIRIAQSDATKSKLFLPNDKLLNDHIPVPPVRNVKFVPMKLFGKEIKNPENGEWFTEESSGAAMEVNANRIFARTIGDNIDFRIINEQGQWQQVAAKIIKIDRSDIGKDGRKIIYFLELNGHRLELRFTMAAGEEFPTDVKVSITTRDGRENYVSSKIKNSGIIAARKQESEVPFRLHSTAIRDSNGNKDILNVADREMPLKYRLRTYNLQRYQEGAFIAIEVFDGTKWNLEEFRLKKKIVDFKEQVNAYETRLIFVGGPGREYLEVQFFSKELNSDQITDLRIVVPQQSGSDHYYPTPYNPVIRLDARLVEKATRVNTPTIKKDIKVKLPENAFFHRYIESIKGENGIEEIKNPQYLNTEPRYDVPTFKLLNLEGETELYLRRRDDAGEWHDLAAKIIANKIKQLTETSSERRVILILTRGEKIEIEFTENNGEIDAQSLRIIYPHLSGADIFLPDLRNK